MVTFQYRSRSVIYSVVSVVRLAESVIAWLVAERANGCAGGVIARQRAGGVLPDIFVVLWH
jgi:hypothetical protein